MELGNLCFGNSRGEFEIPRGAGYEGILERLLRKINPNNLRGDEFENHVFEVFPYYWGDCTCGFDDIEFEEPHSPDCYQSALRNEKIKAGWTENNLGWLDRPNGNYEKTSKEEDKIYKRLCKQFGLSYPNGCAVHCTCDYNERYLKWMQQNGYPDGHKNNCLLEKPNFLYKPTGFQIQWYKYPLRDSYTNMKVSLDEFDDIIDDCIKSLKENK